jgi:hypothetical protein
MAGRASLARQIAELRRVRKDTATALGRAVGRREIKRAAADYQLDSLDAAIATLEWLQRHEARIRDALAKPAAPVMEERP